MKKQVKHLRMLWLLLLLVGGASLFESCVRTSQSDCLFPIRLRFEYVKNRENKDLFNAEVETLDLFLYDRVSGKLVDRKSPSVKSLKEGNVYEWYAPAGDYCVVAWAGNQGRYAYSGENSIDAAVAYAIRDENGKDVQQRHEHLFHGITENLHIDGTLHNPYNVSLRKNTNDIRVELVGFGGKDDVFCEILGDNGAYDFRNRIVDEHSPCRYLSKDNTPDGAAKVWKDFTTLRLWKGDLSRLRVYITKDGSEPKLLIDESLSGLILKQSEEHNIGLDLEIDDEFLIRIERKDINDANAGFTITVNGWKDVDGSGGSLG